MHRRRATRGGVLVAVEEVVRSRLNVVDADQRLAIGTWHDTQDKRISLIVSGDRVLWVLWTDASMWRARMVTLSPPPHSRIKAIVPYRVPVESFWGARVVIANVPAVMMRKTWKPPLVLL